MSEYSMHHENLMFTFEIRINTINGKMIRFDLLTDNEYEKHLSKGHVVFCLSPKELCKASSIDELVQMIINGSKVGKDGELFMTTDLRKFVDEVKKIESMDDIDNIYMSSEEWVHYGQAHTMSAVYYRATDEYLYNTKGEDFYADEYFCGSYEGYWSVSFNEAKRADVLKSEKK